MQCMQADIRAQPIAEAARTVAAWLRAFLASHVPSSKAMFQLYEDNIYDTATSMRYIQSTST